MSELVKALQVLKTGRRPVAWGEEEARREARSLITRIKTGAKSDLNILAHERSIVQIAEAEIPEDAAAVLTPFFHHMSSFMINRA